MARIQNAFEGLLFAAVFTACAFIFAKIIKAVFKKDIGSSRYYSIAVIAGFILHRILIAILVSNSHVNKHEEVKIASPSNVQSALDKPFIAPSDENLESFPLLLERTIQSIQGEDRKQIQTAIGFLSFCTILNLEETAPSSFEKNTEMDLLSLSMVKLYRFAQKNGSSMTLRKYITLSDEFKKQKPQWWGKYQSSMN